MKTRRVKRMEKTDCNLEVLFDLFIAEKKRLGRSPDTISNYRESHKRFMDFLEEEGYSTIVSDVNENYIADYTDYLQEGDEGETLSPASVNHYLREVRAFMYWCQDKYGMTPFPVQLVHQPEVIKETFSESEQRKLIRRPEKNASFVEWRTWAAVNWILGTGNRARSVCNIKISDIDFEQKEIHLRATKNGHEQLIPLSKEVESAVRTFMNIWRSDAEPDDYLFCNIGTEQLSVDALKHSFYDYALERGVSKTSIHRLRHTFAKGWILNGGEILRLQAILGHKTLDMTQHYVHLLVGDIRPDFDEYNPLDNLKKKVSRTSRVTKVDPIPRGIPKKRIKRAS